MTGIHYCPQFANAGKKGAYKGYTVLPWQRSGESLFCDAVDSAMAVLRHLFNIQEHPEFRPCKCKDAFVGYIQRLLVSD